MKLIRESVIGLTARASNSGECFRIPLPKLIVESAAHIQKFRSTHDRRNRSACIELLTEMASHRLNLSMRPSRVSRYSLVLRLFDNLHGRFQADKVVGLSSFGL